MISAGLIRPDDVPALLKLARMNAEEARPEIEFDGGQTLQVLGRSLLEANPTIFVARQDTAPIGYLVAQMQGFYFASGIFVSQDVLFVRPDKRGTRAAVLLVRQFVQWGSDVGAKEWHAGTSTGLRVEQTARLFEKHGAERVGFSLRGTY